MIGLALISPLVIILTLAALRLPEWRALSAWGKLCHLSGEDVCRDDCQLKRQDWRQSVLSRYDRLLPEILVCILGKECPLPAKREALALILEKDNDACQSLLAPARSQQAEIGLDTFIILYGDCGLALAPADLRLAAFFLNQAKAEERLEMLRLLAKAVPSVGLEACREEILSDGAQSEAISILAWLAGKEMYLPQSDFQQIAEYCLAAGDENLARRLVFLAGDYYYQYPDVVGEVLLGTVSGPYDAPTRAIAASILEERGIAVAAVSLREEDLDE